jgi:hypothetical protein
MKAPRSPRRPATITPKQVALVHVAKKQLALSEEIYRAILVNKGGVDSAADLDRDGFNAVMAYLTACGFRSTWTQRTFGRRAGMATPKQIDLIRDLWSQWSDGKDDADLNRWLERSYGVSALRFLDTTTTAKAIAGLKAMTRRRRAAAWTVRPPRSLKSVSKRARRSLAPVAPMEVGSAAPDRDVRQRPSYRVRRRCRRCPDGVGFRRSS